MDIQRANIEGATAKMLDHAFRQWGSCKFLKPTMRPATPPNGRRTWEIAWCTQKKLLTYF